MKETLESIGKCLQASRKAVGLSLTQLSKRNPHLKHDDFSLAETGGITKEALLVLVVNAYPMIQKKRAEVLRLIDPAIQRRRLETHEEVRKRLKYLPMKSQPWSTRYGHQLRV